MVELFNVQLYELKRIKLNYKCTDIFGGLVEDPAYHPDWTHKEYTGILHRERQVISFSYDRYDRNLLITSSPLKNS